MMQGQSPTLKRVLSGQLCSGCGLCAGVAPDAVTMETVAPGYSRPLQTAPVSADAERAIATACPGAKVAPWTGIAPDSHEYWGPWRGIHTGYARDADVRFAGSSGGAISALLIHALGTGQVEQVLHVTADPDKPTRNIITLSTSAQQVVRNAGSRYAASSPLQDIGRLLDEGKRTAFVGKPCDVSALRQLGTVDARVNATFPLMLSFFCGGLPSHAGADRIVRAMGLEPENLTSFRYRGNGWPGMARAETTDGRSAEMSYAASWGGHLSKEVQFRCKICPDAIGGVADIACADAWYGDDDGYPSFEEQEGRSLIVSRTAAGEQLLGEAVAAGSLDIEPLEADQIDRMQPAQARRKRLVLARTASCHALLQPVPKMDGLDVGKAARRARPKELLHNFLGTIRRILIKRR
ncbi:Coenzyme F420 hydrogenase/dehydrogenase, beta subunit C-terminal domain [Sphingobium fluviale]|uniref:Coenzyme F420-reducing hydrogenase n=1 Tax=Sphingobium fluviale TaxID=2506423 RepID=A0A4Q1KL59_9SPHN|nr:Coenzyme F420 hydrogenase/dehydrogenase, beta subunit C-terminal domain [Sphingobium fluviale]RXR30437.1 coenzyme F420-reducing hydrogenase [Sphingobium fluviale]